MRSLLMGIGAAGVLVAAAFASPKTNTSMYQDVRSYLSDREREFDQIPADRRALLKSMAAYVRKCSNDGTRPRLLFVCTHNSRRSHLAQVWAAAAANYYGVTAPAVYSGGTEATAFNPRAVAALGRAGIRIEKTTDDENPIYHVRFCESGPAITAFSKVFSQAPNPQKDFCAIMVCGSADRACPTVKGAAERIAIPYVDPKEKDGTPGESAAYDACCRQIAREMLYAMSLARSGDGK